jgi:FdhD protein
MMNHGHEGESVRRLQIGAMRDGRLTAREDAVAVEEPLEIRLALPGDTGPGRAVSITMRTPGQDCELAVGFLHGEGLIRSREDIASARPCGPTGNVVRVELAPGARQDLRSLERNFYVSSSCGICGKASLDAVQQMLPARPVQSALSVPPGLPGSLIERARGAQDVFRQTGGLHASSLFDPGGTLLETAEDVGRHNALDKLIGSRLLAGALPLDRCLLLLSGRASFELLQKAAAAGIAAVAAIGAPSSLAIELAERTGILLIGFLREQTFNVYAHPERLQ